MSGSKDDVRREGARCVETDDQGDDARSIILRRRARFLALALAAAQTGATACGGKSSDVCLSYYPGGSGGRAGSSMGAVGGYCLQPPGGTYACLGVIPAGAGPCLSGGTGGGDTAGAGGLEVCLSVCLSAPLGGAGGAGGDGGADQGGAGGLGVCLTPPK